MIKKTILYVGGFRLPDKNSSAIRVLGIARMLNDLGYNTKVGGKTDHTITTYTDVDFWSAEHVGEQKYKLDSQIEPILAKVKEVGKGNIKAIIAYNYPPIAFYKLYRYCKRADIVLIPDITEWYSIDGSFSLNSALRVILTNWRISVITPRNKNLICSVHNMAERFNKMQALVLPVVSIEKTKTVTPIFLGQDEKIKFIYAGYPGVGFSKEKVDWCIEVFAELTRDYKNFEYHIVGIDKSKILEYNNGLKKSISILENANQLFIYGRLPHEITTKKIRSAAFLLFVRPVNRVTTVGFPSKTRECFDIGTPLVANATSDLEYYIESGSNGFIFKDFTKDTLKAQLENILRLSNDEINEIKERCSRKSPFDWEYFQPKAKSFFSHLK